MHVRGEFVNRVQQVGARRTGCGDTPMLKRGIADCYSLQSYRFLVNYGHTESEGDC
jgi:hypothetical protein